MSTSYIGAAYSSDTPGRRDFIWEEVQNVVSWLNNNLDEDHNFYSRNRGNCGIDSSKYSDQDKFVKDVITKLHNENSIYPRENIAIAVGTTDLGYGGSSTVTLDGTTYYGCAVYADDTWVPNWEVRGFTWHELAHGFVGHSPEVDHAEGDFELTAVDSMHEITPLCMSYLYNPAGKVDTRWQGGSDPPDAFCGGENYKYDFATNDNEANHNISKYGECAKNEIEAWVRNTFG